MSKFTSKQNKEFWDEFAKKSKNNPFGAHTDKHVVELENHFIISELKSRKIESLLDIGCGNGQRTLLFSQFVQGKTKGIDYSDVMIEEANILLDKQNEEIKNKLSFQLLDINNIGDSKFDVIVSCRCFINQPNHEQQIELFNKLHQMLKDGGSLIIAEQSLEGIERLIKVRKEFGLEPITIKWHNLPLKESIIFPKLEGLFSIKKIRKLGFFYYISRVLYPALIYPDEPKPGSKINELGVKSQLIIENENSLEKNALEEFGAQLLIHFTKISARD